MTTDADVAWEQGSLLPAEMPITTLFWAHPETQASSQATKAVAARLEQRGSSPGLITVTRQPKRAERAAVISQACDIEKSSEQIPTVEVARTFETTNDRIVAEAQDFGSARYFRLNSVHEAPAVILDFAWRSHLDKGFLCACRPDNAIVDTMSAPRRKTLARWLGRRYNRPAIPDADYRTITAPIRAAWEEALAREPERVARWNATYPEFRYRRENDGTLTVFVLSAEALPDDAAWLEVAGVVVDALGPHHPDVNVSSDRRSYHTFTKADELSTEQIDMDWASHNEAGPIGVLSV